MNQQTLDEGLRLAREARNAARRFMTTPDGRERDAAAGSAGNAEFRLATWMGQHGEELFALAAKAIGGR